MKLYTEIKIEELSQKIKSGDKIFSIGSCFADQIGELLNRYGFDCCSNPLGTQYNACSIFNTLKRLYDISQLTDIQVVNQSGKELREKSIGSYPFFTSNDILERPDGLFVTFSHHSKCGSFNKEDFLKRANEELLKSAEKLKSADYLIITLGTSFIYKNKCFNLKNGLVNLNESTIYSEEGLRSSVSKNDKFKDNPHDASEKEEFTIEKYCLDVVSNCHKFPPSQFTKCYLDIDYCIQILREIVKLFSNKKIILTVSPIRHLGDGAHLNQISKSTLLIAIERVISSYKDSGNFSLCNLYYFPSYEIMMDELRDYRWYSEDMSHPTPQAVKYIFEKFRECCIDKESYSAMDKAFKEYLLSSHIPLSDRYKV